ncbi:hypothetical protein [Chelatococcus reniformis]|uniref:Uncharacterized protein n=1 Tax=Chelatococcus reniformis TaxID=1494448 RepID=A0A916XFM0_9HYPH|nr:hypothetical protein [Chelatococcus reniformis]GGC68354.1 hypothetical protein GCM10010994_28660 [Chelatococcus reniformis]
MSRVSAFKLFVCCENCLKESVRRIDVPDHPDAPADIDELMESSLLQRQRFVCQQCESAIGTITGAGVVYDDEEEEADQEELEPIYF